MSTILVYNFLLMAHIGGGIATGVTAVYTGIILWRRTSSLYRTCALTLSGLAVFEVLSGVALAVVSLQITAQSLCTNIALYLSTVLFVETLLFFRMKKIEMPYPFAATLSPVAAGVSLLAAAIIYGF